MIDSNVVNKNEWYGQKQKMYKCIFIKQLKKHDNLTYAINFGPYCNIIASHVLEFAKRTK